MNAGPDTPEVPPSAGASIPLIEVTVAAPAGQVWTALRDREQIRQWHGWQSAGLDAEIDSIYFTDVGAEVEGSVLEPNGGDRFDLTPVDGGTLIRLTRAPLSGDPEWDAYYDDVTEGWITFLHQLAFAVDRHPGHRRRTLFSQLAGRTVPALTTEWPLVDVTDTEPGDRYTAELAGRTESGQVWFRSAHQLGLTVDSWGDGLLVLAGPGSGTTVSVLGSTYGMSDQDFAALGERWAEAFDHPETTA